MVGARSMLDLDDAHEVQALSYRKYNSVAGTLSDSNLQFRKTEVVQTRSVPTPPAVAGANLNAREVGSTKNERTRNG